MTDLDKNEARLISIHRAIKELNANLLISEEDVGTAFVALHQVFPDLEEKETKLSADALKALVLGFVGGLAATRIPEAEELLAYESNVEIEEPELLGPPEDRPRYPANAPTAEEEITQTSFKGGPSGGTAEGQGKDPKYVTQSGVRPTKE